MSYINTYLQHNATMKVNMVLSKLGDFHKMISFFMTRLMGRVIITFNIPLTSYNGPFNVFEVKAVPIRLPNSDLDSLLEDPYQYVAIYEESGALIALSSDDAKKVLKSGHYLIWYPVVRVDTNRSCTIAIFRNNAKMAKELCTYVVRHNSMVPTIEPLDSYLFFLRNIRRYSIRCQMTVHHNMSLVNQREIEYVCRSECSVNVELFNYTGMTTGLGVLSGFESLTCELVTPDMVVPFALPLDDGVARIGGVTRFHTNLIVLHTYYSDVALEAIDGDSSFSEPAAVNIPYHKVEFIDRDEPTRLELSSLLNATGNNEKLYSNYWRSPDFLVSDVFNYVVVGANGLIILVVGAIFIYQQYKIRQIHAIILTMQAMLVPRVATLGVLVLRTTTVKNQFPGQSHIEILVQFGNNYWVIMVALILGLLVVYKVFKKLRASYPKR